MLYFFYVYSIAAKLVFLYMNIRTTTITNAENTKGTENPKAPSPYENQKFGHAFDQLIQAQTPSQIFS